MDKTTSKKPETQASDGKAIASLVLGILSLTGFGLLTGVPAIIFAAITLNNKTPNRGLSLAGLITGIAGTVISILIVALFLLVLIFAPDQSGPTQYDPYNPGGGQPIYQSM